MNFKLAELRRRHGITQQELGEAYFPSNSGKAEYWKTRLDYLQRTRKLMWNADYMHF
ncbi:hypothetical protein SAMN02910358_00503 [Lachnospiraceae bacterium XBB1006]|nr:hypothetical protein SAMN02910358_00503 [Lachnospiraceae bacterium XBB1006]